MNLEKALERGTQRDTDECRRVPPRTIEALLARQEDGPPAYVICTRDGPRGDGARTDTYSADDLIYIWNALEALAQFIELRRSECKDPDVIEEHHVRLLRLADKLWQLMEPA